MIAVRRIDLAAFAVTAAGIVLVASDQGGFFERTWPWAGIWFAASGALALLSSVELRAGVSARVVVAAFGALAGWTALSWLWSAEPSTSLHEALRTPVYLAAAAALVALAAAGGRGGILAGVAAGAFGIAAYSLADRYLHGVHAGDQQGTLLERPLGYANALGILCGIGLVVLAALVAPARRSFAAVVVGLVAGAVLVGALALTGSRASWAAVATAALVAVAARLPGRRLGAAAGLAVAAVLAGVYVWTAFGAPGRLQARGDYWHAAWSAVLRHPLGGTGAGTYDLAWAAYGDVARWGGVLDAHSLYLETFAELGLVGLVLVALLAAPVVSVLRAPRPSTAATAALAGAVAYLVHAGLDWDWEMPAVTVAGIACLAAATAAPGEGPVVGPRTRSTVLAIEVAAIVGYLCVLIARRV